MDPSLFTPDAPGELRKFTSLGGYQGWLFIPRELPPRWEMPVEFWPLLAEAREGLGTLNGIGQTLPNPDLLIRPLQSQEAITSSSIEGTFVTPQQLLVYELDAAESAAPGEMSADLQEVWNYSAALRTGLALLEELPLASRLLLAMHKVLMQGGRGHDKSPGEFRKIQNQIGLHARYVPPPPGELPRLMGNFDNFINARDRTLDPLVACFVAHYQFETIHPFIDGNGRLGRAMLALMIRAELGHSHPWLYMSGYFEQHREEYMQLLLRVSTNGDWTSWIRFCLAGVIQQARDAVTRCKLFLAARDRYHEGAQKPNRRTHALIDHIFRSPVVTASSVARDFSISYHTARKDLDKLVELGILDLMENARQRTYIATELVRIAYHPVPPRPVVTSPEVPT